VIDLKRFRRDHELDQSDVAEAIGINQASISKYETGRDRSKSLEKRILKAFPKAKKYIVPDDSTDDPVIKMQAEEIIYLRQMNKELLLMVKESKESYELMKDLNSQLQKIVKSKK